MAAVETVGSIPWWKEPTKDQWYAWWAAWLGWTLDAFDFTVFLLIMKPIPDVFGAPVSAGGLGDGAMPDPLPRLYERGAARLVEYRLPAVERDLGRVRRLYRVARHA